MKNNKATFADTNIEAPIFDISIGLKGSLENEHYASGTGVIIGNNLAITAQHVIDDYFAYFQSKCLGPSQDKEISAKFSIQAFKILNKKKVSLIWNVTKLWRCNSTDIVLLRLTPSTDDAKNHEFTLPSLSMSPPDIGEDISAFGFSDQKTEINGNSIFWNTKSKTSRGNVIEVYHVRRDSSRLNFPCFQVNARFDGAMSGGPVFNSKGHLCGIICSNLPPDPNDPESEHASYVTSLWPMMGMTIDIDREGYEKGVKYPMIELVEGGFITAIDIENVILNKDSQGNITSTSMIKR